MDKNLIIKLLKEYKAENQTKYKLKRIGLFGSYARNEANDKSDIDIVIELLYPDLFIMGDIKYDLEKIYNKKVDITRLRERMNSFFKDKLEKEAIYV
ncbi:MAG: nucleotidyltransferase [Candidatus Delongbacteria bacterium]|nr:nucleotidyltransferase [Candidatus Delongbacteria bacterium]